MNNRKILLASFLAALLLPWAGCTGGGERIPSTEIRCITDSESHELILGLGQQFLGPRPEFSLNLLPNGTDMAASLDSGSINMIVFSGDTSAYSGKGLRFIEIARRALIPVFSYENPDIPLLARQGATKTAIRKAFESESIIWSELSPGSGSAKLRTYSTGAGESGSLKFFNWLGLNAGNSTQLESSKAMENTLKQDSFGLGYLWSSDFYDAQTGFRTSGLYALPIDFDSSGLIGDSEHIYDDISMFSKALYSNAYPEELITVYYLALPAVGPNKAVAAFVDWLENEGAGASRRLSYSRQD